ncbi:hypothetical protein A5742_21305 [Mycolicibacterium fortuitum]|uniref:Uncharacterized protein n=1 Tax=Mycolicibacterium fortuitum TaxID=1766 RepID=A0ABD6QS78_MYCFO|nr:hypothetical protein A5742_21305 [Mycolicibacterium fortuitum]
MTVARETRERVAQPDVVMFIDHNPVDWHYMDIVIKNFGQTPAYNVRVDLPPLQVVPFEHASTGEKVTTHYVPNSIAVLAPGQEWRSAWESGIDIEEYDGELPSNYVGMVRFDDKMNADKPSFENPISLDINMFKNMHRISTEKSKTVEKALYEISGTLKEYKRQHGGIWVYTVNGADERGYYEGMAERFREWRHRMNERLHGNQSGTA